MLDPTLFQQSTNVRTNILTQVEAHDPSQVVPAPTQVEAHSPSQVVPAPTQVEAHDPSQVVPTPTQVEAHALKSTNVRVGRRGQRFTARLRRAGLTAARDAFSQLTWVAPRLALPLAEQLFVATQRFPARANELEMLQGARPLASTRKGRKLAGWAWGNTGPTVLLVHGWNGRASQMGALAQALASAGYRALAFDLSGHGGSAGRRATAVTLAEDVLHLAGELGPFAAVVAHSFGGPVTSLALLAGLPAERLVFIAPPLESRHWFERFVHTLEVHPTMVPALKARLEKRVGVEFEELSGSWLAPAMQTPLLVIHDRDDKDVPLQAGQALAALWPGAEFRTTSGLGHNRILFDRDVVRHAVNYINQR